MAADPATPAEECPHPSPTVGVMAHEFSHYEGALGPEGKRRTVTYYGPVVGGLPINAWHCEICGLLRLAFPDGRREERHLFPGPQPGLISAPSVVAPEALKFGQQPRVSGLSAPERLYEQLYSDEIGDVAATLRLPRLPALDFLGWVNVVGFTALIVGLFVAAILATAGYSVSEAEVPVVATLVSIFGALLFVDITSPLWSRELPLRLPPEMDGWTTAAAGLFGIAALGLLVTAVLATYTWNTGAATGFFLVVSLAAGFLGAVSLVAGGVTRHR